MLRTLLALAAGGLVVTGPAAAFDGWFVCPPRYYYSPPPVVYYYPVYVVPMACPPGPSAAPAPVSPGTTPPKPMPGGEAPATKGKDEKKSGLTPAEFTDRPRKSEVELATPSAAPPPPASAEVRTPDPKPAVVSETKIEPPVTPTPKTIDIPLPSVVGDPPKPAAPELSIPPVTPTEPGKIPPLTVPAASPKVDATPVGAGIVRPDPPAGTLQIPPIDLPVPSVAPEKKTVSKSSPLSAERSASVKAVAGSPPASGRYTVRFFNHTASAFRLAVDSGSIELPAEHFVDVQIGRAFTWRAGSETDRRTEVPADAAGLEIAVKE